MKTFLWLLFALVMILSFAVLGWIGTRIDQEAPTSATRATGRTNR